MEENHTEGSHTCSLKMIKQRRKFTFKSVDEEEMKDSFRNQTGSTVAQINNPVRNEKVLFQSLGLSRVS